MQRSSWRNSSLPLIFCNHRYHDPHLFSDTKELFSSVLIKGVILPSPSAPALCGGVQSAGVATASTAAQKLHVLCMRSVGTPLSLCGQTYWRTGYPKVSIWLLWNYNLGVVILKSCFKRWASEVLAGQKSQSTLGYHLGRSRKVLLQTRISPWFLLCFPFHLYEKSKCIYIIKQNNSDFMRS